MSIDTTLQGLDLYLRSTDHKGRVTKTFHRVWNADLFMQARERDARKLNEDKRSTLASARRITVTEYHKE